MFTGIKHSSASWLITLFQFFFFLIQVRNQSPVMINILISEIILAAPFCCLCRNTWTKVLSHMNMHNLFVCPCLWYAVLEPSHEGLCGFRPGVQFLLVNLEGALIKKSCRWQYRQSCLDSKTRQLLFVDLLQHIRPTLTLNYYEKK